MTPLESLLVSHLQAQLREWSSTLIDRETLSSIYLDSGEYGALSVTACVCVLCEDNGWEWTNADGMTYRWRIWRT